MTHDYLKPNTLEEALALLQQYGRRAALIAGGTDVMVRVRKGTLLPEVLISLKGIPGLDRIEEDGVLRIGPLVTHRAIERSERIRKSFSALADAVDVLGSVQIRNVATLAGNLCTSAPSADTATPLLVLGARVETRGPSGERTIPVESFFKGPGRNVLEPGEIVTGITIPPPPPFTGSAYWKHQRRQALDLPILGVSVLITLDHDTVSCSDMLCSASPISALLHRIEEEELVCREVRIGLGVAAPTPIRATGAEALLRGYKLSDELIEEAAEAASREATPRDSIRGQAWYRRDMIRVFVKRMAMKSIERVLRPGEAIFPERLW
jgi:carbon-monoxide dehydrogenase medium subunit